MMKAKKIEFDKVKDGVRKYWDYGSKFYDTAPGGGSEDERMLWKGLLSGPIGPDTKNVLDVGTGT